MEDTHSSLLLSLTDIRDTEDRILSEVRNVLKESGGTESFVNDKIRKLFQIVSVYRKTYERFHVTTKKEFEKIIKKNFRYLDVQDIVEEVNDLEKEWDILLQDIDKQLLESSGDNHTLAIGDSGPLSLVLQDARTGQSTCLHDYLKDNLEDFTSIGGKILVISFGIREGAERWLQETKCPYPMLLDQKRKVYSMFGLKRSVYKVWGVDAMVYYAEKAAQGVALPKRFENIYDDTEQMGGDFILDRHGIVKFTYCSKQSWDRPSLESLLSALKKIKENEEAT